MVNYDEIGSILLKYCSFRAAEDLIEQLRELIGFGRHPGAACHELMGFLGDWEKIAAEEPIKGWVEAHRSLLAEKESKIESYRDPFGDRPLLPDSILGQPGKAPDPPPTAEKVTARNPFIWEGVARFLAEPPIEMSQTYEERTTKFIVQARAPMPSLGPEGRGILLTSARGGRPLIFSRADALAMMEALALGLMLMERLR